MIGAIKLAREKYLPLRDRVIALDRQNKEKEAIACFEAEVLPAFKLFDAAIDEVLSANREEAESSSASTASTFPSAAAHISAV